MPANAEFRSLLVPGSEACLEGGYIATQQAGGKSVKFKRMKRER